MAVVGLKSNTWLNKDGLNVLFNKSKGETSRGGEVIVDGSMVRCTEVGIDLTDLTTTDETIVNDGVFLPKGALIEKLEIIATKETAGTNANLNIGLVKEDRSTEYDFDGLLAAGDDFNGGTDLGKVYSYVVGTTDAGSKLGTILTEKCLITAGADTAVWTAGIITVRIYWTRPLNSDK